LIVHFTENVIFLFDDIGKGTPSILPPHLYGHNNTAGATFAKEKKNIILGSKFSKLFNLYFNFLIKLYAHIFLPLFIKNPKNILL
jgi:hypothetical protein